jgi:hypothetical protein
VFAGDRERRSTRRTGRKPLVWCRRRLLVDAHVRGPERRRSTNSDLMASGSHPDVPGSLDDLERKLADLERQLGSLWPAQPPAAAVAPPPPPPPPPPPQPVPAPTAAPASEVGAEELRAEIAELVRFRNELETAANDLMAEHDRLLERLKSMERAADAPAPAAPPAPPAPEPPDTLSFEGPLVIDAGPFADLATLAAFEQSLAGIDGAEAVAVRSFLGSRALIDIRLPHRVALVDALRHRAAVTVIPRETTPGRLVLDVAPGNHHLG